MKAAGWVGIYAVQRSLGVHLPLAQTALVLAAVTFATMVSVAPGNLGFFELGAVASYQLLGIPAAQAAALALLAHVAFLLPILGTGYGTLLLQPFCRPLPGTAGEPSRGRATWQQTSTRLPLGSSK
jgi:uncharacterized membrane protein YbhN (UPF0104 family)